MMRLTQESLRNWVNHLQSEYPRMGADDREIAQHARHYVENYPQGTVFTFDLIFTGKR